VQYCYGLGEDVARGFHNRTLEVVGASEPLTLRKNSIESISLLMLCFLALMAASNTTNNFTVLKRPILSLKVFDFDLQFVPIF
jgi:hypothetical protein